MNIKKICCNIIKKEKKLFIGLYNLFFYLTHSPKNILLLTGYIDQVGFRINKRNWGDELNFHLVKYLSGKNVMSISSVSFLKGLHLTNYACVGSILDKYLNKTTIVWGSGSMTDEMFISQPPQKVLAVRGPLSREVLIKNGISAPSIYGDPALLLPYIYNKPRENKYRCGLIPHFIDCELENVKKFKETYGDDVVVINLKDYLEWTDVIDVVLQCDFVISSSLHGIIVSDAYGVPNFWVKLSENVKGNGYKFLDYFSSVNRNDTMAIDLIGKDICISNFQDRINKFRIIDIDLLPLIKVCPFITKKRLDELTTRYLCQK